MMKLYWAPRTRSLRALWILEEAGVPYERVRLDLSAGEQKSPDYRAINPMAKVPALTDGPAAVAESGAICAYVAEAVPQAGLAPPLGDPARGRYLQWLFFSPGCIEPAFLTKSANVSVDARDGELWGFRPRFRCAGGSGHARSLAARRAILGGRCHDRARSYFGIDIFKLVPSRPIFRAYVDRCLARPALQRAKAIEAAAV